MGELFSYLFSNDPGARIWRALAPAILLAAWFIGGVGVYAVRCAIRGKYRDEEIEAKGRSPLLGLWLRQYFVWVTRLLWKLIEATAIPANAVTTLAALIALASGFAFAAGHFALGGWLYIFSGILDVFDGRLARLQKADGPAGAALDSVLDRYADGAVLCGLAWYYRESWVLLPVLASLAGGFLVSYVRARGEGLGVQVKVGLMQRPERIVCLGAATALSPVLSAWLAPSDPHPPHWLAIIGLLFLGISSQWTALQRVVFLLRELSPAPKPKLLSAKRGGLPRSVISAGAATLADFALVSALVSLGGYVAWGATAVGCLLGAAVSFSLGRYWAFTRNATRAAVQARRYAFVSATSLLLNMGGVALLSLLPNIDYRISWLIVRAAVFSLWNFPLHRDYVFGGGTPRVDPLRAPFAPPVSEPGHAAE